MLKVITFSRCLLVAIAVAGSVACMRTALAADGYEGVIAAPSDDKNTPNNASGRAGNDSTPGYSGVVADPSAPAPAESADQYSPTPGRGGAPDLITAAIIHDAPPVQAPNVDLSASRHNLIAGKPAIEYVASQQVAQAMSSVNNEKLSDAERTTNARNAYQNLSSFADGLRSKQAIPDNIYKSMGLTDDYINDERNGNAAALTHLDAALSTLKSFQ